jgi:hypothetical protein
MVLPRYVFVPRGRRDEDYLVWVSTYVENTVISYLENAISTFLVEDPTARETMSEKVLVTGGFGLVGSQTVRRLAADGHRVIATDLGTEPQR